MFGVKNRKKIGSLEKKISFLVEKRVDLEIALKKEEEENIIIRKSLEEAKKENIIIRKSLEEAKKERDHFKKLVREQSSADLLVNAFEAVGIIKVEPKVEKDHFQRQQDLIARRNQSMTGQYQGLQNAFAQNNGFLSSRSLLSDLLPNY